MLVHLGYVDTRLTPLVAVKSLNQRGLVVLVVASSAVWALCTGQVCTAAGLLRMCGLFRLLHVPRSCLRVHVGCLVAPAAAMQPPSHDRCGGMMPPVISTDCLCHAHS